MFAGSITRPERIELVECEAPELGRDSSGEIIFAPRLACLCGSDLPYFVEEHARYPLELGHSLHEMVGTVVESSGDRFRPGDAVLAVPVNQRGLFERFIVSETRAIPLDPHVPLEHAVLAQPLGTVLFALRKLPSLLGVDVAIVGQGPIGQLFSATLRALGARRIIAVDRLASRLASSARSGATDIVDASATDPREAVLEITGGALPELVVEAVGHRDQQLDLAIDLCRPHGRILSFGVPPRAPIDRVRWHELFFKNLTIQTSVNPDFAVDFPLAMRWIAERRIDVAHLVTHRYPIASIQEAYETFRDRRDGALKVLLEFPGPRP